MALFDAIISGAAEKFGLGDKSGTILSALLSLMIDQKSGGFGGFLDRFKGAGLGDIASSWISGGGNTDISNEQLESALGSDTINNIASEVGVEKNKATSALGFMLPQVVNTLTPDGNVPDDESLLSKIGDFLSGIGGAAAGAVVGAAGVASAVASDAVDVAEDAAEAVGDAAEATYDKGKEVVDDAADAVEDVFDGDGGGSIMNWLLPLLLLGLLLLLGFWYCGGNRGTTTPASNANAGNTAGGGSATGEAAASSVNIEAKDGKYFITGAVKDQATLDNIKKEAGAVWGIGNVDFSGLKVDADATAFREGWWNKFKTMLALPDFKGWKNGTISWTGNVLKTAGEFPGEISDKLKSLFTGWTFGGTLAGAANAVKDTVKEAVRKLTDVSLSDDIKLQAYTGGIEAQLIKFIQSDEYKNATEADLKDKWFDFDDLNFKFGTTELEPDSKRQLDNIVAILKAFPDVKFKIGGYTDKKGDDAANKTLSDGRAKAVKAALEKAGVGAQVPEAEGYGEEFAKVAEDASDEERLPDRRTSVRLLK